MDIVFPAERTHFPGVHKIDAPISGLRIADKNFTDTRIFLKNWGGSQISEFKVIKLAAWKFTEFSPLVRGKYINP